VASQAANGSLLNTDYIGPTASQGAQAVTIQVQTPTTYHIEYYQPLSRSEKQRQFAYTWPGDYSIDDLSMSVRVPPDTTSMVTDPAMQSSKGADGSEMLIKDFGGMKTGQQFTLQVTYSRSSDTLSVPQQGVQPSKPLGSATPGRVLLSNYLPYILGGLGILAIGGAAVYFLQPRRRPASARRHSHAGRPGGRPGKDVYCHQCGARAQSGDRFCRVCGTRLRIEE
jgi:hypothetical protein